MVKHGWIPVTSFGRVYFLDPPVELPADSREPGVVRRYKPGHVHMVAVDADWDVSREDGRVLRHHLTIC